jgi:hypothetical protein
MEEGSQMTTMQNTRTSFHYWALNPGPHAVSQVLDHLSCAPALGGIFDKRKQKIGHVRSREHFLEDGDIAACNNGGKGKGEGSREGGRFLEWCGVYIGVLVICCCVINYTKIGWLTAMEPHQWVRNSGSISQLL